MKPISIACLLVTSLIAIETAEATTIDFEAQGTSAPSVFDSKLNSPLSIGIATFRGGELLKNETGGTDTTVVYATNGYLTGYTDPLVITFSQPISNPSLLLTNELADTYTLTDNLGGTSSIAIGKTASQTISLSDTAVTQLTLSTASTVGWDFAIDNVSFTAVPEIDPESGAGALGLLAAALLILRGSRQSKSATTLYFKN